MEGSGSLQCETGRRVGERRRREEHSKEEAKEERVRERGGCLSRLSREEHQRQRDGLKRESDIRLPLISWFQEMKCRCNEWERERDGECASHSLALTLLLPECMCE